MSAIDDLLASAASKAKARTDPSMHTHAAPEGYRLKGVSTLLDADGVVRQTWVKTAKEMDGPAAILDAFALAVAERGIPPAQEIKAPKDGHDPDLLTVIPWGDPHMGMLAWHRETGNDFDLEIAERTLVGCNNRLVSLAPMSERCLIIDLGDFFHTDNQQNRTEASGHQLDVDSRWPKIFGVGLYAFKQCIDASLRKFLRVDVIVASGNHDPMSSLALAVCLSEHYRNEPRVHIDTTPSRFHWYEFGLNLIGVTHGHTVKAAALPGLMAYDKAEAWGRTKNRHWYTGHVHHESYKEYPGCSVETVNTTAAGDAWHHGQGYRSRRKMICDVWHKIHGNVLRHTTSVESLREVEK